VSDQSNQPTQNPNTPQRNLQDTLADIIARLTALENSPAVNPAAINKALEDHPLVTEFRAFLKKWSHPAG
jgi:hypothetical protein